MPGELAEDHDQHDYGNGGHDDASDAIEIILEPFHCISFLAHGGAVSGCPRLDKVMVEIGYLILRNSDNTCLVYHIKAKKSTPHQSKLGAGQALFI